MPQRKNGRLLLTTTAGATVSDNQKRLTAGDRGPVLMLDCQLIEKLAHQNRKRNPERIIAAKDWGGRSTLSMFGDISHLTCASLLQPGAKDLIFRAEGD